MGSEIGAQTGCDDGQKESNNTPELFYVKIKL